MVSDVRGWRRLDRARIRLGQDDRRTLAVRCRLMTFDELAGNVDAAAEHIDAVITHADALGCQDIDATIGLSETGGCGAEPSEAKLDDVGEELALEVGVRVGKRQVEELARDAAQDFDAY